MIWLVHFVVPLIVMSTLLLCAKKKKKPAAPAKPPRKSATFSSGSGERRKPSSTAKPTTTTTKPPSPHQQKTPQATPTGKHPEDAAPSMGGALPADESCDAYLNDLGAASNRPDPEDSPKGTGHKNEANASLKTAPSLNAHGGGEKADGWAVREQNNSRMVDKTLDNVDEELAKLK